MAMLGASHLHAMTATKVGKNRVRRDTEGARGVAWGVASATIALAVATLTGCATEPLTLDIREQAARAAEKIPHTVVFFHSRQMREEIQTVPGNVSLRIGEASDRALRSAYAQGFVETREVSSLEEFRSQSETQTAIALLQPEIVGFQTVSMSPQLNGPFVAEIIYRFTLFNSAGAQAGAWDMHSLGTYDPEQARREHSADFRPDSRMWVAEAPRRAIEAVAARLLAGFDSVPELMRLRRGLPLDGSNVPFERQKPGDAISPAAKQARYPGALTLTVNTDVLPASPGGTGQGAQPGVVPLRVTVRNDGAHRLLVDPALFRWEPAQSANAGFPVLSPLPAAVVPKYLAGSPAAFIAVGPMSPGIGMLPTLIAALANAASQREHEEAMQAWKASVQGDLLTGGAIDAGAERTGIVYFSKLPATYVTLLLPVTDLDDAVRYTVRLDMSSFKP